MKKSLFIFLSIFFLACPEPPEKLECGPNQIEVNGECQCQEGYHWNDDETECLMDTTSHNFIWSVDTLGYWGYLEDVEIIDENNIWVVGQILTDTATYNAAHWNGSEWELIRIQPEPYLFGQYTSVFGFSSDDIWFGSSIVVHWNGENFTPYGSNEGYPGGFYSESIWGSSSDDMYFVGNSGSIVHYDGTEFVTMDSGTEDNINDIWGSTNSKTGETAVYCVVSTMYQQGSEHRLLQINADLTVMDVFDYSLDYELKTLWFDHISPVYVAGTGLHHRDETDTAWTRVDLPNITIRKVRGAGANDIIAVGAWDLCAHYNGIRWQVIEDIPSYGPFDAVAIKNDMVVVISTFNYVIFGQRYY